MLSTDTRDSIASYLRVECTRYIQENLAGSDRSGAMPFHARLMPVPFPIWSQLSERSFSTRSGSWFQQIAVRVGRQFNQSAVLAHRVSGPLSPAAEAHITAIINDMDHGNPRRIPSRTTDIAEVLTVQGSGGEHSLISDLYILRHDGTEMYFEMKTPQPNKDTSIAMKRGMLLITAIRKGHAAEAYGSAAYNPYGDGQSYLWNYARQFMEIHEDLLLGRDFWTKIGEDTTYDELLAISEEVGQELIPLIRDRLPLDEN